MKAYQIVYQYNDYHLGCFTTPGRIYLNKEDAEKAKEWIKTVPQDPYGPDRTIGIEEVEIEEKFTPWISDEAIAAMQKEQDDYEEYLQQMYGTDWYPEDCPEE